MQPARGSEGLSRVLTLSPSAPGHYLAFPWGAKAKHPKPGRSLPKGTQHTQLVPAEMHLQLGSHLSSQRGGGVRAWVWGLGLGLGY